MSCVVFAGPSLPRREIADRLPSARVLPPAAQGDLVRAARSGARAIGLIDGYFEGVPSVWHKEVLWAMSRGVHVFGAASMGALRAAELHRFGMRGVGAIFEAYRDGGLEDDDEVAVLHGPPETGFVALSEAMVNIRATLERAVAEGAIPAAAGAALASRAKALFYQDRSWERLIDSDPASGPAEEALPSPPPETLAALRAWLPGGRVDQKRLDALAMVDALGAALEAGLAPLEVDFAFETTAMWDDALVAGWSSDVDAAALEGGGGGGAGGEHGGAALRYERVLDELRLRGPVFGAARLRAQARLRALREAERAGLMPDDAQVGAELQRFRMDLGLTARAALETWLAENDMDLRSLQALIEDEARLAAVDGEWRVAHGEQLLAGLRRGGDYAELAARAREKQRVLAEAGHQDPGAEDAGLQPLQLLSWFLRGESAAGLPQDREALIAALGLSEPEELYRLIAREYLYCRYSGGSSRGQRGD